MMEQLIDSVTRIRSAREVREILAHENTVTRVLVKVASLIEIALCDSYFRSDVILTVRLDAHQRKCVTAELNRRGYHVLFAECLTGDEQRDLYLMTVRWEGAGVSE